MNQDRAHPIGRTGMLLAAVALLAAVLAVFAPHLGNGFVYDDHAQIEHDPYVLGEIPWSGAFTQDVWANLRGEAGTGHAYYRPLFLIVNRVLAALGGGSPLPFHLAGLGLHLAAIALAFAVLRRLLESDWPAFCAAALFALHPAVGESVYWAAVLSDQLALVGLLSALLCLLASRDREGAPRTALVVAATAFAAVALLSKETAVVVAPIVTLEALWHPPPVRRSRLLDTAPIWAVTGAFLFLRSEILADTANVGVTNDVAFAASRAGFALAWDARHLVVPLPLSPFHDFHWASQGAGDVVLGIAVLFALAALAGWAWRSRPACLFWLGWAVLPLLPRLTQLFLERRTTVIVAERYLLLSLVPVCAGLVALAAAGLRRWVTEDLRPRAAAASLATVLLACAVYLHGYGDAFANDRVYFAHAAERTVAQPIVLNGLAIEETRAGRPREALALLERALALEPRMPQAHLNRGSALLGLGRPDLAIPSFRRAIELDGRIVGAHLALAGALRQTDRMDEAERHFASALRLDPNNVAARIDLGTLRYRAGDTEGAIALWEAAVARAPDHAVLLFNLGMAHRAAGNRDRADAYLHRFLACPDQGFEPQRRQAREWLAE